MPKKTVDMSKIGKQIKLARNESGLTQKQLSEKAGIAEKYLSNIETGNRKCSLNVVLNITNALKVSMDYIINDQLKYNETVKTDDYFYLTLRHEMAELTETQKKFILDSIKLLKKYDLE